MPIRRNVDSARDQIDPLTVIEIRRQSRSLRYVSHSARSFIMVASGELEKPRQRRSDGGTPSFESRRTDQTGVFIDGVRSFESVAGDPRVPRPDAR